MRAPLFALAASPSTDSGERTSPAQTNCTTWENDVNNAGWDANFWVQEAKKLHTQYIVLAAFHSRLGYARAWPSKIPGTCSTKRDYLGELLTAAHNGGLRLILYMISAWPCAAAVPWPTASWQLIPIPHGSK